MAGFALTKQISVIEIHILKSYFKKNAPCCN